MWPDQDFDDEIRGHMALSVKERIECGEDPEGARLSALREFGNVTLMRESMRAVWRPRWLDTLLRTGGITGDAHSDLHWRWTPTREKPAIWPAFADPIATM